jgi:hypothetical protein
VSRWPWWGLLLSGCQLFYDVNPTMATGKDGGGVVDAATPTDTAPSGCQVIDEFPPGEMPCATWGTAFGSGGSGDLAIGDGALFMTPSSPGAEVGCTSSGSAFTFTGSGGFSVQLVQPLASNDAFSGLEGLGSEPVVFGVQDDLLQFGSLDLIDVYQTDTYVPQNMQ